MNNLVQKFWIALCWNTGEGDSGGAGDAGGQAGAGASGGEGSDTLSGAVEEPSPSLLGSAAAAAGQATVVGGEGTDTVAGSENPPVVFDPTALTLPEGIVLDEDTGKSFAEVLGDDKLSVQERGQKLVDLHLSTVAKITETVTTQLREASAQSFKDINAEWLSQVKQLPEFKANPEAEIGKVLQACVAVGAGEDFFKAVDLTGAGNNPAILQVLHRLAQPFLEGGSVSGDGKTAPKRELGSNIYSSATKQP